DKSALVFAKAAMGNAAGKFVDTETRAALVAVFGAAVVVPSVRLAIFLRGTLILPNTSLSNTTVSSDTDNTLPEYRSPFCISTSSARSGGAVTNRKIIPDETNRSLVLMARG